MIGIHHRNPNSINGPPSPAIARADTNTQNRGAEKPPEASTYQKLATTAKNALSAIQNTTKQSLIDKLDIDTRKERATASKEGQTSNLLVSPLQEIDANSAEIPLKGLADKEAFNMIYEQLQSDSISADKGSAYKTIDLKQNALKMTRLLGLKTTDSPLSKAEILERFSENTDAKKIIANVYTGTERKIEKANSDIQKTTDRLNQARAFIGENSQNLSTKALRILESNVNSISWTFNHHGIADEAKEMAKALKEIQDTIKNTIKNRDINMEDSPRSEDKGLDDIRTFLNKSVGDFWTSAKFMAQLSEKNETPESNAAAAVQIKFSAVVSGMNQAMLQGNVQTVGASKKVSMTDNRASLQNNQKPQIQVKKMKMDMSKIYSEDKVKQGISDLQKMPAAAYLAKSRAFRGDLGIPNDAHLDKHLENILDTMMVKRDLLESKIAGQLKNTIPPAADADKQAKTIATKVMKGYAATLATSEKSLRRLETASWTVDNNDNFQQRRLDGAPTKSYIGKLDPVKAYAENKGIVDLNFASLTKDEKAVLEKFEGCMVKSNDSSRLSFDADSLPPGCGVHDHQAELVVNNKIYDVTIGIGESGEIQYKLGNQESMVLDKVIAFIQENGNTDLNPRDVEAKKIITVNSNGKDTENKVIHNGQMLKITKFTQGTEFQIIGLPPKFSNILAEVMGEKTTLSNETPIETTVKPESWNSDENDWDDYVNQLKKEGAIVEKDGKEFINKEKLEHILNQKNDSISPKNSAALTKKLMGDAKMHKIEKQSNQLLKESLMESSKSESFTRCIVDSDKDKAKALYDTLRKYGAISLTGKLSLSSLKKDSVSALKSELKTLGIAAETMKNLQARGEEQAQMCDFFNDETMSMRVTYNQEVRNLIENGDFMFVREMHDGTIKSKFIPVSNAERNKAF